MERRSRRVRDPGRPARSSLPGPLCRGPRRYRPSPARAPGECQLMGQAAAKPAPVRARLCIVAATILWSSGSVFAKVLREDTALGLNAPLPEPSQIASFRVLCAGVLLLPLLRRRDLSFRPMMVFTAACFALMNWAFLTAISYGTEANAILLHSTAPLRTY